MKAIINGKIIKGNEILENQAIIFDEKIIDFIPQEEFKTYISKYSKGDHKLQIIDAKNNYVSPGFIDIHIHGSGGRDTMDGTLEDLKVISSTIAKHGVTSFLPTTMTMHKDKIYTALIAIREAKNTSMPGATVLGAHMEGPFISEKFKGAQSKDYILKPSINFIKEFMDVLKIITLAPEEDTNLNFIKEVSSKSDITLSLGHTNATYEETMDAINAGIAHATHTFNAMTPLNHRKPGAVGAIFNSKISCEFIADTIHIHPELYRLILHIKGQDKVVLITDSMRAGCMEKGIYELGGQKVIVDESSARLEDGTLAGSILSLNMAVKNILKYTDLSVPEAVSLATINPAKVIHVEDKKGSLEVKKDSDIIIFNDDLEVLTSIVNGNIIHKMEEF